MPPAERPAKKPVSRFPLWLHPTGQWCRKLRGRCYYFGTDRDAALRRYAAEWDGIKAGRPRPTADPIADVAGATVGYVCNALLADRQAKVDRGELSAGSWRNYHHVCAIIVATLGRNTPAATLRPADFGRLRAELSRGRPGETGVRKPLGPNTLTLRVLLARSVFRFGKRFTGESPQFGDELAGPPARVCRVHRQQRAPRILDAGQMRELLDAADPIQRAHLLLGLNCAYGAADLDRLRDRHLEERPGWLLMPRHKTGAARRCPLWPETIAAVESARRVRPQPQDQADADRLFLTPGGRAVIRETPGAGAKPGARTDFVLRSFFALCRRAGVRPPKGAGFYALRHMFRTVAGETRDERAVDLVMGHERGDMGTVYTERITDGRLQAVVDHVRAWLFASAAGSPRKEKPKR